VCDVAAAAACAAPELFVVTTKRKEEEERPEGKNPGRKNASDLGRSCIENGGRAVPGKATQPWGITTTRP
jgi:hypothetical protein